MAEQAYHVLDLVDDYLHGALYRSEANYVANHCRKCPVCKVALEEAEKRSVALDSVPVAEPSEQLIQATLSRIDAHERRQTHKQRRNRRILVWSAAAAALAIAVLHIYYWTMKPSPYDLRIFGQTELFAGTPGSLRVQVVDFERATPVANAAVQIELRALGTGPWLSLASFRTNDQGTGQPRFQLPDSKPGDYELRVSARPGGAITRNVKLSRSWKVMLSTDRPVYQPGHTIHIRALTLRSLDLKPIASQDALFTIRDPKGNLIFKKTEPTSVYGISAVDCPLAQEILEGTYAIECRQGDTASKLAVEVKKYVLPKFKIEVAVDQPYYRPGQKITGKLDAAYFFGKPVAGGMVELQLQANTTPLKLTTDERGHATFAFLPPANRGDDARLELLATVTDTAGQTQSRLIPVIVAAKPFRLEIIPEAATVVMYQPNTVYALATQPDGRPAADVTVSWGGGANPIKTDKFGVAAFAIEPSWTEGTWTFTARDPAGDTVVQPYHYACGQASHDFLLRTDKAVYRGGDTVKLTALGSGTAPIYIDLLKDGQTIFNEAVPMSAGRGEYQFDLPAELFGTVQLWAYRFAAAGPPLRKTRVLYIHPSDGLQIAAILDKPEYRPGGLAQLQFTLKDNAGRPTPGALSLAAVDEAVFAVLQQAPGSEKGFYTVDPAMLGQVLAGGGWSPNGPAADNDPERRRFEQALFARPIVAKQRATLDELIDKLLPFVENSRRIFDVLDQPDWEERLGGFLPEQTRALLREATNVFPLTATTHFQQMREYQAFEANLRGVMKVLWIVLGVAGFAGLVVFLAYRLRRWSVFAREGPAIVEVLVIVALVATLVALMVPSVQKVREATARTQATNDLKQIELGIANFQDANKGRKFVGQWAPGDGTSNTIVANAPGPRLRERFPETLLWRPQLITDDQGKARLDLDLADSITTWRLSASAVAADGRLGALQTGIKVFQPFFVDLNLPIALTRNDEISVPVVLYNYLDKPQRVELKLHAEAWFAALEPAERGLDLGPREVKATSFRIKVLRVGLHDLQVTALGSGLSDALKRRIEVLPDGRRIEAVHNGRLNGPAQFDFNVPAAAIDGSPRLFVKLYPSAFSQLVEGIDAIFRMPYGCFEQTSSCTYPNVLALDYIKRSGKSVPAVEAKARQYIHLGYQRLLGFEVRGGGFDWFGNPPANRVLTAYGLLEFQDMARVHDVDPDLIDRTRKWLLHQQQMDGTWEPDGHTIAGLQMAKLSTTAYVAWAVFSESSSATRFALAADRTRSYLTAQRPEDIADPHTLALVSLALQALDPSGTSAAPYLRRLGVLHKESRDGKLAWWETQGHTPFYGSGRGGNVETTALATLALLQAERMPIAHATIQRALSWIAQQRDAAGTWHSTQATVLALKALLAGSDPQTAQRQAQAAGERRIELALSDGAKKVVTIPADQAEVMQQLDLTDRLSPGRQSLTITDASNSGLAYQVVFRYHEAGDMQKPGQPLQFQVVYDRDQVRVGDTLAAKASIINRGKESAPMLLAELPVPAGFTLRAEDFAKLVEAGTIAKWEMQPGKALVYLRGLDAGKSLELPYRLQANNPVRLTVPAARVYEYYNPDRQAFSVAALLTVTER